VVLVAEKIPRDGDHIDPLLVDVIHGMGKKMGHKAAEAIDPPGGARHVVPEM
jgi:hypothetical protein